MRENSIFLERQVLGHPLSVLAVPAGGDLIVVILGGCAPHVGSVSVGRPADTAVIDHMADVSAAVKTILLPGHRDDVVGDSFARSLADTIGGTVSVSCGIHYKDLTRQEINTIVEYAQSMLYELIQLLSRRSPDQ